MVWCVVACLRGRLLRTHGVECGRGVCYARMLWRAVLCGRGVVCRRGVCCARMLLCVCVAALVCVRVLRASECADGVDVCVRGRALAWAACAGVRSVGCV